MLIRVLFSVYLLQLFLLNKWDLIDIFIYPLTDPTGFVGSLLSCQTLPENKTRSSIEPQWLSLTAFYLLAVTSRHPPSVASTIQVRSAHKRTDRRTLAHLLASLKELVSHGDTSAFSENVSAWVCAAISKRISGKKRSRAELKLNCGMASEL